jgi:hypothetical protein
LVWKPTGLHAVEDATKERNHATWRHLNRPTNDHHL